VVAVEPALALDDGESGVGVAGCHEGRVEDAEELEGASPARALGLDGALRPAEAVAEATQLGASLALEALCLGGDGVTGCVGVAVDLHEFLGHLHFELKGLGPLRVLGVEVDLVASRLERQLADRLGEHLDPGPGSR